MQLIRHRENPPLDNMATTGFIRRGARKCLCSIRNKTILTNTHQLHFKKINSLSTSKLFSSPNATEKPGERFISQITLKVRSFDEAVLDSYTQFLQRAAGVLSLDVSKRIILPCHTEKRTLLKSPHIYKKHRVQYELRTHARMLQMCELAGDTADIYLEYVQRNIPEGVSMSVEQTELESIPEYIASSNF